MNKAFLIVTALLLVSVFGAYETVREVSRERDNVMFTKHDIYGDPSVLNGLELKTGIWGGQNNIIWHSDLQFSATGFSSSTETEYVTSENAVYRESTPVSLQLYDDIMPDRPELATVMGNYYYEYNQGKYYDMKIMLKDYFRYYPVKLLFSVGTELAMKYPENVFYDKEHENGSVEEYNNEKINGYFRIKVADDDCIVMKTNETAGIYTDASEMYHISTRSTANDDTVFFYISNRTAYNGQRADKKYEIEPGYGIFSIPYGYIDQYDYKGVYRYSGVDIDVDSIKLIYSMDKDELLWDMRNNNVTESLELIIWKEGEYILKVISYDGLLRQELSLGFLSDIPEFVYQNNFLIERIKGTSLNLYQVIKGRYERVLYVDASIFENIKFKPEIYGENVQYRNMHYYYDGIHLVAVGWMPNGDDFTVGFFDEKQLIYAGWFETNVNGCFHFEKDINIGWKE